MNPSHIRPAGPKGLEAIAREWDAVARRRFEQIERHEDITFHHVLLPCVIDLCSDANFSAVLDVGCGSGYLTQELARTADVTVGIDVSAESIALARAHHSSPATTFVHGSIEDYAGSPQTQRFSLVVASMTLMAIFDLRATLQAVRAIIADEGHFVVTITHPFFWPLYWEFDSEPWFEYTREIPVEWPYRVSVDDESGPAVTHVHRPLAMYAASLRDAGFVIEEVREPMPPPEVESEYPRKWVNPRYLGIRCTTNTGSA